MGLLTFSGRQSRSPRGLLGSTDLLQAMSAVPQHGTEAALLQPHMPFALPALTLDLLRRAPKRESAPAAPMAARSPTSQPARPTANQGTTGREKAVKEFHPDEPIDERIGWVTKLEEVGDAGVEKISSGERDRGGISYGPYQLSSKMGTMGEFLADKDFGREFAPYFAGTKPGTAAFNEKYDALVKSRGEEFEQAQHDYVFKKLYRPVEEHAHNKGFDISHRPTQEALWSSAVQNGPSGAKGIIDDVAATGAQRGDKNQLIRTIYAKRLERAPEHEDRYSREEKRLLNFERQLQENSNPQWPTLHAREHVPRLDQHPGTPVDPARIRQMQAAFDAGATEQQLVMLARRLGLGFESEDLRELKDAIDWRDRGGTGAQIIGEGFNPYGREGSSR